MSKIETEYGKLITVNGRPTGTLYGSGYGQDAKCTAYADRAAVILAAMFPQFDVVKRGNSSGKDCAALIDLYDSKGQRHCLKLGAFRDHATNRVRYDAMFPVAFNNADACRDFPDATERRYDWQGDYASVSCSFDTADAAQLWMEKCILKYPPEGLVARRPA